MSEKLNIQATLDNKPFMDSMRGMTEAVQRTRRQVEESGLGMEKAFKGVRDAAAMALAGFSTKEFIQQVVQVRGQFQQLEVAFKTMLGSAEKADALMSQLVQTAAKTPFDLQGVTQGAKQLLAYGIEAEKVNDTLVHLGDIAAGLSLPLNDLVYLYGTTMTQGRMFTQDLRQFMGRGIPIAEELAKQFGVTKDKVGELVTAGKVGAEEFNKAIMSMSSEGGKFAGLMEAQSKTITGQISNIEDAIDSMFNNIGQQSEGIINGSLSVVASLVENYEKVGEVILGVIATYGVYKAAVMTVTALQALQTAGVGALTAAETIHYGWLVLVQKAQALLNATMLANPYVLAATAVAGLASALIFLNDSTSAEQEATESLNNTMDELAKTQEEYNKKTEEAITLAQNDAAATTDRDGAMQLLIARYPEIIKKYIDEEGYLTNILQLKKEIAVLDGKLQREEISNTLKDNAEQAKKYASAIARYRNARASGRDAMPEDAKLYSEAVSKYLKDTGKSRFGNVDPLRIEQYFRTTAQNADKKYARNLTKNRITDFTTEGGGLERYNDAQLKALQKRLRDAQTNDKKNTAVFISDLNDYLTYADRESLLTRVEGMISARNQPRSTPAQRKAALKKELDDAKKALADFDKSSTQYTANEAEKKRKELQDAVDTAEKAYKKFGGPSSKSAAAAARKTQAEEERRKRENEQADQIIVRMKEQTESDISSAMEEGIEKRMKELKDAYKKEIDEIDRNEKAIREKRGGSLTDEDTKAIEDARAAARKKYDKEMFDIDKDRLQAMRDYLREYGSFEQQKLAIAEDYEQRIKDAQYEGDKKRLKKEMEKALSSINYESISMGIDWRALFSGVGSLSKEMMLPMLEQLQAYTKTEDYRTSDILEREKVVELIDTLRQYVDNGQEPVWQDLSTAMDNFNASVVKYQALVLQEKEAIARRDKSKEDLKAGKITQEQFNAVAKEAEEMGLATADARKSMQDFGQVLNETSDELTNYASKLTKTLSNARTWENADGFSNIKDAVSSFDQLKGTLDTELPKMGEGMAKNIGSGISSVLGKGLSSLGGSLSGVLSKGFGGIVGIVAQIPKLILSLASAVKDFVTGVLNSFSELLSLRWIDDLINSILGAIGNLIDTIFDLPENIAKMLGSVIVNGIGGLLNTIIGRLGNVLSFGALSHKGPAEWFTNGNEEEVQKTTEDLTKANERLTASVDRLCDEMSKSSGSQSIKTALEALEAQEKIIENQRRILDTQQHYHSAHHSNASYWDLDSETRNAVNALLSDYAKANHKNASTIGSDWDSFAKLTPEEINYIRAHNATLWNTLTEIGKYDKSEFFEAYADLANSEKDILDSLKEALTQTTFEGLKDNFISQLMDMETTAEDFADNFTEMMMQAVLNARISDLMDKEIQDFYDKWSELSKDSTGKGYELTKSEVEQLSGMWDSIVENGMRIRDEVAQITGYSAKGSAYKQDASTGSWQNLGEETAQELNGRFTALQISNEKISEGVITLIATMTAITSVVDGSNITLTEIRNLMITNNAFLEDILSVQRDIYKNFGKKLDKIAQ